VSDKAPKSYNTIIFHATLPSVILTNTMNRDRLLAGFSKLTKGHRRYVIQNSNTFLFGSIFCAAIEIQRVFRGYLCRLKLYRSETEYMRIRKEEVII
jgi:hypothetical protein